jgi:hypothetical protein
MATITRAATFTSDKSYDDGSGHRVQLMDLRNLMAEVKSYAADSEIIVQIQRDEDGYGRLVMLVEDAAINEG